VNRRTFLSAQHRRPLASPRWASRSRSPHRGIERWARLVKATGFKADLNCSPVPTRTKSGSILIICRYANE
jgi:hypothetical protein